MTNDDNVIATKEQAPTPRKPWVEPQIEVIDVPEAEVFGLPGAVDYGFYS